MVEYKIKWEISHKEIQRRKEVEKQWKKFHKLANWFSASVRLKLLFVKKLKKPVWGLI